MVTNTSPPAPNAPSTLKKHSASTTQKAKQTTEKIPQKRIFAIFMDYKNLELNLSGGAKKFSDFSWLLNPILECGTIAYAFIFIPENCANRMAIHQLSNKHSFFPILCTHRIEHAVMKDKDTVDATMESLAMSLIIHSDVTDILIISGDADFQKLANFAIFNQRKVTVLSAATALSGRFIEMHENKQIELIKV